MELVVWQMSGICFKVPIVTSIIIISSFDTLVPAYPQVILE